MQQVCQEALNSFVNVFLISYTHIPIAVVSLAIGILVLLNNKGAVGKSFFLLTSTFTAFIFVNFVTWLSTDPLVVIVFWALFGLLISAIFISCIYFSATFLFNKDISFKYKILLFLISIPALLITPTNFNIKYFDSIYCIPIENINYLIYYYSIGILALILIPIILWRRNKELTDSFEKRKNLLFTIGMEIFILLFVFSSFLVSYLNDIGYLSNYNYEQYGFIGMVIFMSLISYLVVQFRAFNIKLLSTQALVIGLAVLTGAQIFISEQLVDRLIAFVTFSFSAILGFYLVKAVKNEVRQREELQIANTGQENLIHIMNHQVKGYLAKGRNIFAELRDDKDYGLPEGSKHMAEEGFKSLTEGVDFVQQILRGSSAVSGQLQFSMKPMNLKTVVEVAIAESDDALKSKGLTIIFEPKGDDFNTVGDDIQLREAVKNVVGNSINYTEHGGLSITLEKKHKNLLLSVKDTGVGITKEDMPKLFQKGGRGKDSLKYNVNSTGYGLAFVKGVIEAHKGRVWAESHGANKGSTFYIELPLA